MWSHGSYLETEAKLTLVFQDSALTLDRSFLDSVPDADRAPRQADIIQAVLAQSCSALKPFKWGSFKRQRNVPWTPRRPQSYIACVSKPKSAHQLVPASDFWRSVLLCRIVVFPHVHATQVQNFGGGQAAMGHLSPCAWTFQCHKNAFSTHSGADAAV